MMLLNNNTYHPSFNLLFNKTIPNIFNTFDVESTIQSINLKNKGNQTIKATINDGTDLFLTQKNNYLFVIFVTFVIAF